MTIELLGIGIIGVLISAIAAYFAGNKAATKKAAERAKRDRAEQEVLRARDAEIAAQQRAEAHELRRRIENDIEKFPDVSDGDSRSASDRLRDEWSRD